MDETVTLRESGLLTRSEMEAALRRRYREQAEKFPLLRAQVSEALYVRRNMRHLPAMSVAGYRALFGETV